MSAEVDWPRSHMDIHEVVDNPALDVIHHSVHKITPSDIHNFNVRKIPFMSKLGKKNKVRFPTVSISTYHNLSTLSLIIKQRGDKPKQWKNPQLAMEYALDLRNNAVLRRYRMNSIPFTWSCSHHFLFCFLYLHFQPNLDPALGKIQPTHWKGDSVESLKLPQLSKISSYFTIPDFFFPRLQTLSISKCLSDCTQGPKGMVTNYPSQLIPPEKLGHQKSQGAVWSKTFSPLLCEQLFVNRTVIYPTTTFSQHQTAYNFNFHCLSFIIWAVILEQPLVYTRKNVS